MSDDRFKDARRDLMEDEEGDGEDESQQQDGDQQEEVAEGKTALVDLDALSEELGDEEEGDDQPSEPDEPEAAQDESQEADASETASIETESPEEASSQSDRFESEATQQINLTDLEFDPEAETDKMPPPEEATPEETPGGGSDPDASGVQFGGSVEGDAAGAKNEGKTDYIDISDFAEEGEAITPDEESAGYEGSTQFVSVEDLEEEQEAGDEIANDEVLQESFNYGEDDIYRGDITVIFGENLLGKSVVLRRVWAEKPSSMPQQLRQRIQQLNGLEHQFLINLNGLVASDSGLWAEFDQPEGYRLTAVLDKFGAQPKQRVLNWLEQMARTLAEIHEHDFVYANMTTDAIWVQQDNSIRLEPFDVVRFAHRGDLGPYGPPEMESDPEEQQLDPGADVYSLAMIAVHALTGKSPSRDAISDIEDEWLADFLKKATHSDKSVRFDDGAAMLEALEERPEEGEETDSSKPSPVVIGAAAVVLIAAGAFFMMPSSGSNGQKQGESGKANQAQASGKKAEKSKKVAAKDESGDKKAADKGDKEGEKKAAKDKKRAKKGGDKSAPKKAASSPDPRLTIKTAYSVNPPKGVGSEMTPGKKQKAKKLFEAAKKAKKKGNERDGEDKKLRSYKTALDKLSDLYVLRGSLNDSEQKLFETLVDKDVVRKRLEKLRDDIGSSLKEGNFGIATRRYRELASLDYRASATKFFAGDRVPEFKRLKRDKSD